MQEFQNERVKEGLSIIKVPPVLGIQEKERYLRDCGQSRPLGGNSYCTLLKDQKENEKDGKNDEH